MRHAGYPGGVPSSNGGIEALDSCEQGRHISHPGRIPEADGPEHHFCSSLVLNPCPQGILQGLFIHRSVDSGHASKRLTCCEQQAHDNATAAHCAAHSICDHDLTHVPSLKPVLSDLSCFEAA
eukprot:3816718-Amphidinium_carterae.1